MKVFLRKLDEWIYRIERILIVSALIVMVVVVFTQVILRFFNRGFPWAEELARYLMIWAGFLGASIATRQRRHLKIDVLPRFLPQGWARNAVIRIASLISAGFCLLVVKVGYDFVANSFNSGRASTSLGIPIWIMQLSIPLTTCIIACRFLGQALGEIPETSEVEHLIE